jgi:dihydrofolate reductase
MPEKKLDRPTVSLIVACDRAGAIATDDNKLSFLWTSRADKELFVRETRRAGVIVCGHETFKTFPKGQPLPDRLNLVYTRNPDLLALPPTGYLVYVDEDPANLVRDVLVGHYDEIMICGGAQIYDMFMGSGLVDRVYLTIEPVVLSGANPVFLPFLIEAELSEQTEFYVFDL